MIRSLQAMSWKWNQSSGYFENKGEVQNVVADNAHMTNMQDPGLREVKQQLLLPRKAETKP